MSRLSPKEHYQQLRRLACEPLWAEHVAAFDRAAPAERAATVAVVRAVGVVFSESGTPAQRAEARAWLRPLLRDPDERIRRYALAALPKLGAGESEEAGVLALLEAASSDRERKFAGRALEKIGGAATLAAAADPALERTRQKATANLARREHPGTVRLDHPFAPPPHFRLHLHCRRGLEDLVAEELRAHPRFALRHRAPTLLAVEPTGPFRLADIFALRSFSLLGLPLGRAPRDAPPAALAAIIAAPATRRLLEAFTAGPIRYRLEFLDRGHQRAAVRELGDRVFALCPALLNDSRDAPWQIAIHDHPRAVTVELTPRLRPDPRFAYRRRDVPAASHPPLAAAMARLAIPPKRLAGPAPHEADEVVWDPFCGSGLELIERARLGGVARLIGTDLSPEALEITAENLAAAGLAAVPATLAAGDFRDSAALTGLRPGDVSLVLTNPPLGRRVPIPDLRGLIADLFAVATHALRPGGRLVFVNPVDVPPADPRLQRDYRQRIDLGGFDCHLERYVKTR